MRRGACVIGAALAAGSLASAVPAQATGEQWGLNGTYTATSNGEWATTNQVRHDEASIRSVWTISTQCSYPTECTGTVTTDMGWSAPIYRKSGIWYVKRLIPDWEPCQDGTKGPGLQIFRFWPARAEDAFMEQGSPLLLGSDQTTGQSGNCGINRSLVIEMPFKMTKNS